MTGIFVSPYATDPATGKPNYLTPSQAKSAYDYSKALMTGSGQQPVHAWTQGVSNMVNALVGGNLDYQTGLQERAALRNAEQKTQQNVPDANFPSGGAPPTPFSERPESEGGTNNGNQLSGNSRAESVMRAASKYGIDPHTMLRVAQSEGLNESYAGGDKGTSFGAMQLHRGGPGSVGYEFEKQTGLDLADPRNEDAANEFAAKWAAQHGWGAWMGAHRIGVNGRMGIGNGQGSALAFNAPTTSEVQSAPAVQAMNAAMGGTPPTSGPPVQVAGGAKPFQPLPIRPNPAPGGQPMINPNLIQRPPAYQTRGQLIDAMSDPWLSEAQRTEAYHMGLQQGQPIFMPSPTGVGQILVNPYNPGQQQYFKGEPHYGKVKLGDMEIESATQGNQGGGFNTNVLQPGNAPAPLPASAPSPVGPRSEAAPNAPAPKQVASLNPAIGSTPAPDVNTIAPDQSNINSTAPLARFAQAGPPGGDAVSNIFGQGLTDAYRQKQAYDQAMAVRKAEQEENLKKRAELANKKYDDVAANAEKAKSALYTVDEMESLLKNPNLHQGLGHGIEDTIARTKDAYNRLKDPMAPSTNAPNEIFDKNAQGLVLQELKPLLQGTGQVRLAEINLLTGANANRNNSPQANAAILRLTRRALEYTTQMGQMAAAYRSGGPVVDPVDHEILLKSGEGDRIGLDEGFDKIMKAYSNKHPLLTETERKSLESIEGMGEGQNQTKPTTGEQPDPKFIKWLQEHDTPENRASFKKRFPGYNG